ncbi:hypothetical protein DFH27DRAFT_60582 [Peziza echinospora]|nr:hypothetical protein DFH27DRAFT_60582 [Peziza echinospora]
MGQSHPTSDCPRSSTLLSPPTLAALLALFSSTTSTLLLPESLLTFTPHAQTTALSSTPARAAHAQPTRKTRSSGSSNNVSSSSPSSASAPNSRRSISTSSRSSPSTAVTPLEPAGTSLTSPTPTSTPSTATVTATPINITLHTLKTLKENRFRTDIFRIMERGIRAMYEASSMGWDERQKMREMELPGMRFLVASIGGGATTTTTSPSTPTTTTTTTTTTSPTTTTPKKPKPVGYLAFELVEEPVEYDGVYEADDCELVQVMYCWELHISPEAQRTGLGRHLMTVLHLMARAMKLPEVRLTVFRSNSGARRFYEGLGYTNHYDFPDVDYLILRKLV